MYEKSGQYPRGCATTASRPSDQERLVPLLSVRIASSLRADMIFGKDRWSVGYFYHAVTLRTFLRVRPSINPAPAPKSPRSIPNTWVTVHSDDIGDTFGTKGLSRGSKTDFSRRFWLGSSPSGAETDPHPDKRNLRLLRLRYQRPRCRAAEPIFPMISRVRRPSRKGARPERGILPGRKPDDRAVIGRVTCWPMKSDSPVSPMACRLFQGFSDSERRRIRDGA